MKSVKANCKCEYCNKDIIIEVPEDDYYSNPFNCKLGNSCNYCIPKNSATRDGINESLYIEYK